MLVLRGPQGRLVIPTESPSLNKVFTYLLTLLTYCFCSSVCASYDCISLCSSFHLPSVHLSDIPSVRPSVCVSVCMFTCTYVETNLVDIKIELT